MKNDALKKHHFWILLGVVPLLVLIAVVMVTSGVGDDTAKAREKTEAAVKNIAAKQNPKSDALIGKLEGQVREVGGRKQDLWKANWDRQKDLYTWPNSPRLKAVEQLNLKFGAPIPNDDFQYGEFKKPEVYLAEFSAAAVKTPGALPPDFKGMADTIAPTQFKGGWRSVLRYVDPFPVEAELTSEQIWLLMEDIWVQRSLLDAVRSVNAQMARFDRVKYEKDGQTIDDPDPKGSAKDPLRRKFKSRVWEVELEVAEKDGKKSLTGRLTNHTDRLQLTGVGSTMVLKVWLQPDAPGVEPFVFKILGNEFVPGRGAVKADGKTPANVFDITPLDDHILPVTATVAEIYKVEQVFDARTVPVRRIEAMRLGKTDSRYAALQANLLTPKFPAWQEPKTDPAATTALPGADGATSTTTRPADPTVTDPAGGEKGDKSLEAVVNGNKKRYVEVTDNVRRMPVGVVLLVDQAYQQDVMLAFANSPLRFQVTQATWARYRLGMGGLGTAGSAGPDDGGGVQSSGPGVIGEGLRGSGGGGFRGGPDFDGGRPPFPGSGPPGSVPATGPGTVSESQLTSGMIELSVYGIVSLYEKPDAPGPEAPKDGKDPKDAAGPGPKGAKPRRRR
ncbi:MAG: hypothetical protein C0501_04050 [Isosphaera sp.]|nr:hypothetical protein [Isosphaera sp.]